MVNDNNFYLYRLDPEGNGEIYGKFPNLMMAKLSADLLLIREFCFILSGDLSRIYFYENGAWDYDLLTEKGKSELLDIYPSPYDFS